MLDARKPSYLPALRHGLPMAHSGGQHDAGMMDSSGEGPSLSGLLEPYSFLTLTIEPVVFSVTVRLSVVHPDPEFLFPERLIQLAPGSAIVLGRSSSRDDNLTPTPSNGWFDSPVMSREHAKLGVDEDANVSSGCNSLEEVGARPC